MTRKEDELLQHNYDGIQEYDNTLPRWWVCLFWITIVFAVVYVGYYELGPGLSQVDTLALELDAEKQKASALPPSAEITEASLLLIVSKQDAVSAGKAIFEARCTPCHGAAGQGIVGPNLTDDYWIHGGSLLEIQKTIMEGVAAKGMVPWKGLLPDDDINRVTAFIRTLRGTNPPGAKVAEGTLVNLAGS